MNTQTIPGETRKTPPQLGLCAGNTVGTSKMHFDEVVSQLSTRPLRGFRQPRLDDVELSDDLRAAQAALAESGDTLPYEDVRRDLGLAD